MQTFQFKDKTFEFPIGVYIYFGRLGLIANVLLPLVILFFIINAFINKDMFTAIFGIFIIILFGIMIFLTNKPRLILHPNKIVFVEHGLIKPKELFWQDCILHATFDKHHATKKEIALLHFCYQDNKNEMQRFACLNLNNIRFDDCHFDKDDTLKFFEHIKAFRNNPT